MTPVNVVGVVEWITELKPTRNNRMSSLSPFITYNRSLMRELHIRIPPSISSIGPNYARFLRAAIFKKDAMDAERSSWPDFAPPQLPCKIDGCFIYFNSLMRAVSLRYIITDLWLLGQQLRSSGLHMIHRPDKHSSQKTRQAQNTSILTKRR